MRVRPSSPLALRYARGVAACALVLTALSLTGRANQISALGAGVYSGEQATRGRDLYQLQCAECHGNSLEGASGPPLVGDRFLANWSARPLTELADKIQRTMPFIAPGSLSRPQSMALTAYILQAGKFPSGAIELDDGRAAQIAFPAARLAAASPAAGSAAPPLPPPEGNLAELMRAIAFPNSNIIFNVQVRDPGAQTKKDLATAPFDYVVWGSTVYPGWLAVDQAAVALTETAALLLTPGRQCQNGKPVPVDRDDWKQYVAALQDAGKLAHRASQARNFEAFTEISERLNNACANCHKVYRDKGGTEGSGVNRCQ
jgi:S-disulfanyl-L-cysteine oxidoreductase SoxD